MLHQDFYALLEKLKDIPVLIIASTKDKYTKDESLLRVPLRSSIKLVVLEGNHNVLLKDPERVSTEILKFID